MIFYGSYVIWIHHHQTTICVIWIFGTKIPSVQSVANLRETKTKTTETLRPELRHQTCGQESEGAPDSEISDAWWCLKIVVPTFGFCLESKDKNQDSHIKRDDWKVFFSWFDK